MSTSANQPSTSANQPSTSANQPSTSANQPSTSANQPSTFAKESTKKRIRSVHHKRIGKRSIGTTLDEINILECEAAETIEINTVNEWGELSATFTKLEINKMENGTFLWKDKRCFDGSINCKIGIKKLDNATCELRLEYNSTANNGPQSGSFFYWTCTECPEKFTVMQESGCRKLVHFQEKTHTFSHNSLPSQWTVKFRLCPLKSVTLFPCIKKEALVLFDKDGLISVVRTSELTPATTSSSNWRPQQGGQAIIRTNYLVEILRFSDSKEELVVAETEFWNSERGISIKKARAQKIGGLLKVKPSDPRLLRATWKLTDIESLKKKVSGECICSELFGDWEKNIAMCLELYPNGRHENAAGKLEIFVRMIHLPEQFSKRLRMKCETYINSFSSYASEDIYEGDIAESPVLRYNVEDLREKKEIVIEFEILGIGIDLHSIDYRTDLAKMKKILDCVYSDDRIITEIAKNEKRNFDENHFTLMKDLLTIERKYKNAMRTTLLAFADPHKWGIKKKIARHVMDFKRENYINFRKEIITYIQEQYSTRAKISLSQIEVIF